MTATLPARRRDPSVRCRAHAYGYLTLEHEGELRRLLAARDGRPAEAARVEFGYGGQSFQRPGRRDAQHRDGQSWEDVIVGGPQVIADGWWTQDEMDAVERAVIRGQWDRVLDLVVEEAARRGAVPNLAGFHACRAAGSRPRYNVAHGDGNPLAVDTEAARLRRWARDDAAGRPRWVPSEDRAVPVLAPPARLRPSWLQRTARRAWVWLAALWLLLSALLWSVLAAPWDAAAGAAPDLAGLAGWSPLPSGVVAGWWTVWAFRRGGRQARRRRRR